MEKTLSLFFCAAIVVVLTRCTPHPPATTEPPVTETPAVAENPKPQSVRAKPEAKPFEKPRAATKVAPAQVAPPIEKKAGAPAKKAESEPYRYNVVDSASMNNEIVLTKDKILIEEETPSSDTSPDSSLSGDEGSKRYKITQGYRIQVYATTNFKDAEKKKEDLLSVIEDPIYVVYDPPYYKIRAGNFVKEDQAKDLKKALEEMGNDAWVVQSKIRVRTDDEPKKKKSR